MLICHNCAGFGVTIGPVLAPVYDGVAGEPESEGNRARLREESVVYRCLACDGVGFVTVVPAR